MNSNDPWRVMQAGTFVSDMVVPAPYFGHPFYGYGYPQGWATETGPDWENSGRRGAPVFVGGEPPAGAPVKRSELTAAIAPAIAPATGGFTMKVDLDDRQVLHGSICIDGKCYETSIDLAPAIEAVMEKIAAYHASLHDGGAPPPHLAMISGAVPLGAVDQAVDSAARDLIGCLVGRHVEVACGNFLDDIGNALSSVYHGVTDTIDQLKGPITAAAAAGATALAGPEAGALASKLTGPVLDAVAGKGNQKTQAKQVTAAAEQSAQTNPTVAKALGAAKQAVATSVAAHHVNVVARRAAAGHGPSKHLIAQLLQEAEAGDPVAHAVTPIVANAFETVSARRGFVPWYPHPPYYGPPHGPPYYGPFYPPMMSGNIHGGLR